MGNREVRVLRVNSRKVDDAMYTRAYLKIAKSGHEDSSFSEKYGGSK